MGRRKTKFERIIKHDGELHTISEWSAINHEKPITIYNRIQRNNRGITNYTNGQIVGSEDLPEPKTGKDIKPEAYKKRNIKEYFEGNRLALDLARRCLV